MSKLQPIVTVSSMEVEYIASFVVVQNVVWVHQLLRDMGRLQPTKIFIDNMSARQLAINSARNISITSFTGFANR